MTNAEFVGKINMTKNMRYVIIAFVDFINKRDLEILITCIICLITEVSLGSFYWSTKTIIREDWQGP